MSLADQLLADLDEEVEDELGDLVKKEDDDQIDEAMEVTLAAGVYDRVTDVAKLTNSVE
jgi:hypothetical protein